MMKNRVRVVRLRIVALILVVAAVVMLNAVQVKAQGSPPLLTLKESVKIALERNLDMKRAFEEVQAARERQKEARTGFLPSLSGSYSYRRLSELPYVVFEGREIDVGDMDQYRFTGTIEQPLFTGFATLSNYQLAKLGLDVAKIQLVRARLDLILLVRETYFSILTSERILEVRQQSVRQLQAGLDVAKNFYEVGMSPKIDVLEAEVRLAEAKQELIRAENALSVGKAQFNTILRRPVDQEVAVLDVLSDRPYKKRYELCMEIALKKRPELMEAEKNVASAEKEITLTKSAYYPKVSVSSNYYRAGDDPGVNGSDFVDRENWDVMAQATITFFEWGKTRYEASRKRARLRQARQALERIKDDIRLEVKTSYLSMQAAEKYILVAKKRVESAEENFRISGERYRQQVATATEVLDAQTRLTEARTNYTNALAVFNIAQARLIRNMGLEDES
ncbi:MAG TPA: TolC family protein [Desulfobacterales bacterium]|nr:TolC family protein [Desulfobacterales bacterium]